eukprot:6250581-Alexandrium_andersonii.AAC.1
MREGLLESRTQALPIWNRKPLPRMNGLGHSLRTACPDGAIRLCPRAAMANRGPQARTCLLYTSDAADDM